MKALVVDDDRVLADVLAFTLRREGFEVVLAHDGEAGFQRWADEEPDLVVLDVNMPRLDGFAVCRRIRAQADTPIILLTVRGEEDDIVHGLGLGADDYITKPFSPRVLIARVRAALRRKRVVPEEQDAKVRIHELAIDPRRRSVEAMGKPVNLTYTEFQVLHLLASRPGWVFTRGQILDAVRGDDYPVTDRSVDVQIVGLRKKLGPCGKYIETVRGVGYRFRESI